MSGIRVVIAEGDAVERGRTLGRELSELIERSLDFYHRYLDARGVTSPQLQELLTPYLAAAEAATPDLMATITGMAQGATVPVMELFAVNAFEELEPLLQRVDDVPLFLEKKGAAAEHCTSFAVRTPDGRTLLGHNEQWLYGDAGNLAVVIDRPGAGRTPVASPVCVCCLPSVGMNARGLALGIQSVTASDDRAGVPRVLTSRAVLGATDLDHAVRRASMPERAGGYGYTVAARGGVTATIETTGTRTAVRNGDGAHTNHYLDPDLAAIAPPPSEGSTSRLRQINDLLRDHPPNDPEDAMDLLSTHGPSRLAGSVCLHPDPQDGDDAECIVFSMVAEVESGRMWVATGNPCEHPFEEIDLQEAFG